MLVDGLVLAATIAEDRDASACVAGLSDPLAAELSRRMAELAAMPRDARRAAVEALAKKLRTRVPADALLPARAHVLLSGEVEKALGKDWYGRAPLVRRGFDSPEDLRKTLRRLAAPAAPDAEAEEREAANAVPTSARAIREAAGAFVGEDEARVLGALWLGHRGELRGDARSRPWRRCGAELAMLEVQGWLA